MFRRRAAGLEVLLAHPGGPFFARKDDGAWSIPKGEVDPGEDLLAAACREFAEEVGFRPAGQFIRLHPITQKGGKVVHAWAVEGDCDPAAAGSNTFTMEWPPHSGKHAEFPEIDRVAWFDVPTARRKIKQAQAPLVEELERLLAGAK